MSSTVRKLLPELARGRLVCVGQECNHATARCGGSREQPFKFKGKDIVPLILARLIIVIKRRPMHSVLTRHWR